MTHATKEIGNKGEQLVAEKLVDQGFSILARNYKKRYGEIDVIACKDDLLVFVEVKTRKHASFDLTQVITRSKQKKIVTVAKEFLATHTITDKICRFDVALLEQKAGALEICYIPNAFIDEE